VIAEVRRDDLPLFISSKLGELGVRFKEVKPAKGYNMFGIDWVEVEGLEFKAFKAYFKLTVWGMDAAARGGGKAPAVMEYAFTPAKQTREKVESVWEYVKTGLFSKEVSGVRWKGGGLAERLNADGVLKENMLRLAAYGMERAYIEEGEVRFRFNTQVVNVRKGLLSVEQVFYCIPPTREMFEAAQAICRAL